MEKTELTPQFIGDIVVNDFKENQIPPFSVTASTSQLLLKTTDCDIKDTIHYEISNCRDQLVPEDSSAGLENCHKSESSSDVENDTQATGHVVPSQTLSDVENDTQATGHVVPSQTSSDVENDTQATGHVVPSQTLSDVENDTQATGHVVPSQTSSDVENDTQATGHVVPSETSSDVEKDMQAIGHVDLPKTTSSDVGNYRLPDFSKKNWENNQWHVSSQTDLKENASIVLGDRLMTTISDDGAENIYQLDASFNNMENGTMSLFEASSNDHLVPIISTDHWENIDHFLPEDFDCDIGNTHTICCGSPNEETTSNDSQLVPEILNDSTERNCSLNEISIFNMKNNDHASEASSFGIKQYDKPIPNSPEVRRCLKSELEHSTTDFSDDNKQLKFELLIPCMKQDGKLKDVIDSQSNLTELGLNHSNNGEAKPELSGTNDSLSCETINFEIRSTDQSNSETQVSNLKNNTPSSSETSDSNVRKCHQSKLQQCEGVPKSVDELSQSDASAYHHKPTLTGGSSASEKSSMDFRCAGINFSQSNNYSVSSMTTSAESSRFSYTSNVPQPLHHTIRECETITESSLTPLPKNRYNDLDSMWCNPSCVQQTCFVKESMQFKQSESTTIGHGLDLVQYKRNDSPNICPEVDIECNQCQFDVKASSIRQRAVDKSPNMVDTHKSSPLGSSAAKQVHFGKHFLAVVVLTFLVLTVTFACLFVTFCMHYTSPLNTFAAHVNNSKKIFPNQSEDFWRTIRASVFSVFNKDEFKQPVVIIIASSTPHAPVASCIAKHISAGFESSWNLSPNMSVIDINRLKHLDAASQKLQLDNDLNLFFENHRRKSLIVENLQFLDPRAALIFYSYCDTDNAPFKDVMILFTLYFDEKEENVHSSSTIENYLENMWRKDLTLDKVKPLVNRMAGNIVVVKGEHSGTLSELCS